METPSVLDQRPHYIIAGSGVKAIKKIISLTELRQYDTLSLI